MVVRVKLVRFAFQDVVFPIRKSKEERNKRIMDDLDNGMSVKDAAQNTICPVQIFVRLFITEKNK